MIKKQIKLNIEQETINYLQRLNYEVMSRTEVITKLIEMHKDDSDDSLFTCKPFLKYSEELSRVKAEYELAKLEVEKTYIPKSLYGVHQYNWSIDFSINEMKIDVLCDCGVEALNEEEKEGLIAND